jgi:hypothetical protein
VQYWPITAYRVSWCPGGNRYLGFSQQLLVSESDAYTDALQAVELADKVQGVELGADVVSGESQEADVSTSSSSDFFHNSAFAGCDADPYDADANAVCGGGSSKGSRGKQQRRQRGRDDITFRQTVIQLTQVLKLTTATATACHFVCVLVVHSVVQCAAVAVADSLVDLE